VQAVVSEKQIDRVRLHGKDSMARFKQAVDYLESEQVPIKEVSVSATTGDGRQSNTSFVVSSQNIFGWEQIKGSLKDLIGKGIAFDTDLAALSLIGEGLNRNNLTLLETIDLLARSRIPVVGITTTSFRISLLVPRSHIEKSVRLCHAHWVAGNRS